MARRGRAGQSSSIRHRPLPSVFLMRFKNPRRGCGPPAARRDEYRPGLRSPDTAFCTGKPLPHAADGQGPFGRLSGKAEGGMMGVAGHFRQTGEAAPSGTGLPG
jgi:hypothetical protein